MITVTGTLHVIRQTKHAHSSNPWAFLLGEIIADSLVESGKYERQEWPPIYYMNNERKNVILRDGKHVEGTHQFQYRFNGQPKIFRREMEGWIVSVRGNLREWGNGLGGEWKNYKVLSVEPPDKQEEVKNGTNNS